MASIEIQQSTLTRLAAQAESQGISLDAYLEQLAGLRTKENGKLPRLSGEELERLIDAEATSSDTTYRGTYPRADIYRDHD
jgi:hypothetical protein